MAKWVELKAADGHALQGYVAEPEGEAKAALVLVQEIFGVNAHIRSVCDSYAAEGYLVVAPAIFDRIERGVDLSYSDDDKKIAFSLYPKLDPAKSLLDVAAACEHAKSAGKKVGVVGFCYGGLMAWLSATRAASVGMEPGVTVGYYAGGIGKFATEEPSCPVMLHFGTTDSHIGSDQIDAVRVAHPEVQIFLYEGAGHAFSRTPDPASYNEGAAKLARERTLEFFAKNLS